MTTATESNNLENRVIVFMPTGRDALLICTTLEKAGLKAEPCVDSLTLNEMVDAGAGALLIAEEAFAGGTLENLFELMNRQPVWSDLPVVLFASNAVSAENLSATVGTRLNATIVERPIRITMLVSAVRGALRARERQYASRNLLNQLAESDHQKDLFLATLSHELRTPLNAILGWIQVINAAQPGEQTDIKHALKVIERNARAQSEIISDILFVSRVITGKLSLKLERIDLKSVVRAAIETVRPSFEEKQIKLHTQFETDDFKIRGDADRLQQVFWNLLSNAVKFTSEQGQIDIRVSREDTAVKIEIADSGKGISPEFLPHVFERFRQADSSYTRQIGGLGLGLAIVKHLVTLHDGDVSVASRGENLGAVFTVTLPLLVSEQETAASLNQNRANSAPTTHAMETPNNDIRILLVEDDDDSREMLKIFLEQNQMQVVDVGSAADALEAMKSFSPDVLVSDIGLPNEDGFALIRQVRELAPEHGGLTPAVALTGYVSLEDRNQALDIGYQEHLSKPVEIDELLKIVKDLAARRETIH